MPACLIALIIIAYIIGAFWFSAAVLTAIIKAVSRRDAQRDNLDGGIEL